MMPKSKLAVFLKEFPWLVHTPSSCPFGYGEKIAEVKVSRVNDELLNSVPRYKEVLFHNWVHPPAEVQFRDRDGHFLARSDNKERVPFYRAKAFSWRHPSTWFSSWSETPMFPGHRPTMWVRQFADHYPTVGEWLLNRKLENTYFLVLFIPSPEGLYITIYKPPKEMSVLEFAHEWIVRRDEQRKAADVAAHAEALAEIADVTDD